MLKVSGKGKILQNMKINQSQMKEEAKKIFPKIATYLPLENNI